MDDGGNTNFSNVVLGNFWLEYLHSQCRYIKCFSSLTIWKKLVSFDSYLHKK